MSGSHETAWRARRSRCGFHPALPAIAGWTLLLVVMPALITAWAADPEPGRADCRALAEDDQLTVDLEIHDLFTADLRKALGNGFTSTLATQILLVAERTGDAVAEQRFAREIRFDVWEETYTVKTFSDQGIGTFTATSVEEVEAYCRQIPEFRICPLNRLDAATEYHLLLQVLVSPISQEQLERTKKWVRGGGGGSGEMGSDFSFGSVLTFFIGRSAGMEEIELRFRTAPFRRPQAGAGDE